MTTINPNNSNATLAAILSDNADGAVITPDAIKSALVAMETAARDMGVTIGAAENNIAASAKVWGCNYLNLVKVHNHNGDDLAEASRAALGWSLLDGDAGKKVKQRFNTWRSNVGVVAGRWSQIETATQTALLGGTTSFITVYKTLIEADAKAKKEKADAEKAAEKAAETAAPTQAVIPDVVSPATLADMGLAFAVAYAAATKEERDTVADIIANIVATFNSDADMDADVIVPVLESAAA
jgi:hypothetical protein